MPTTTELRQRQGAEIGHFVVFDGIEPAFCDRDELVGFDTGGGHDVQRGLQRAGLSYRFASDLRTGDLMQSPASIPLDDFADTLVDLFKISDGSEQSLVDVPMGTGTLITPAEDLTARTDLHGANVGLERIGSGGERHQFPVPPDAPDTWGMLHTITLDGAGIEAAPVSTDPIVWNGRRCALYRVYIDTDGTPRPAAEARRLWMGTLKDDGKVKGRRWTLEADGPESLLRKPLALGFQRDPVVAVGDFTLEPDGDASETWIGINLFLAGDGVVVSPESYSVREGVTVITGTTLPEIVQDIRDEFDAAAADASLDGPYEDLPGCMLSMDAGGRVRLSMSSATESSVTCQVCLHRKVWALLGYDVEMQKTEFERPDSRFVDFHPMQGAPNAGTFASSVPGGDYWTADFVTGYADENAGLNNGGATRLYEPMYSSGTQVLLHGLNEGRGQIFRLGDATLGADTSQSTVAHPGQLMRPIASLPTDAAAAIEIDGTPCDRTGFFLFIGKRRFAETDEVFDEAWIGEASWVAAVGQQAGLIAGDTIIVTKWWQPSLFGFSDKGGIESDWVARVSTIDPDEGVIRAVPIAVVGYSDSFDDAQKLIPRVLASTGTSTGWDSFAADGAATLAAGENEPSEAPALRCDAEVAPLGLAIPASWVAAPSTFDVVAARVENPAILRTKAAFTAGYPAGDLLRSLMQPWGAVWHLRDGSFGIWCPADGVTLADATLVIDRSVRGEIGSGKFTPPEQGLRYLQPIDRWRCTYNRRAHFGDTSTTEKLSLDRAFAYRPGTVQADVMAHHMRQPLGLVERLPTLSNWWARRHFPVPNYPIDIVTAEEAWPGTIVRLTDPELADPRGQYSVTNRLAIVTALRVTLDEGYHGKGGTASVDLLVLDDGGATPRYHGPVAQAFGYDSATHRIYIAPDSFGLGSGAEAFFVEPTYDGVTPFGGDAVIECWQWDGETLAQTCSGTVASAGAGYIELTGAITGTYYRDRFTIVVLRPTTTANAAYVDTIYSPVCDAAGQWTDVATPTDGYNWEP